MEVTDGALRAVSRPGVLAASLYGAALTWWAASWNLRNSVLMAWTPVEPVWIGSLAIALCVVHRLSRPVVIRPGVAVPLVLLVASFVPGAVLGEVDTYGATKVALLATTLLPVLCAAALLLDDPRVRRCFVVAQVVLGLVVAAAAAELHEPGQLLSGGRLTLPTVDTISTGRFVGVAVLTLLLVGFTVRRARWFVWPAAMLAGTVLVQVGSRGPLLGVVISLFVAIIAGRALAGRRALPIALASIFAVAVYAYARIGGGAGGKRIVDSVQGGLEDTARSDLLADAWLIASQRPWGVGWGDFALHSPAGAAIANADGAAYAHNIFAETLAEGGVLALLGVGVLVVLALRRARRGSTSTAGLVLLGATIYWVLNAQVSSDVVGNRFMWLMLLCGLLATVEPPVPAQDRSQSSEAAGVRSAGQAGALRIRRR